MNDLIFIPFSLEQYGPVIQYRSFAGEQVIATCDPKAISYMLMHKTSTFPKPHEEVRGLERLTGRGLLTVEGDVHRRQRKIMSPSFTQLQTNTYLPIMTEQAEKVRAKNRLLRFDCSRLTDVLGN